jgi:hypothetical protein
VLGTKILQALAVQPLAAHVSSGTQEG